MEINSKMASKDGITEKEVLSLGNAVLTQAGGPTKTISSIRQFNSIFFSELFQSLSITSSLCIDSTLIPLTTSEAHRCQIIINKLSKCLPPQVSLSHIKGSDISQGNLLAIKNLIEIFAVLLEASLTDDSGSDSGSDDDSNVITGEGLNVINKVLNEELIKSSTTDSLSSPTHDTPLATPTTPSRLINNQSTPNENSEILLNNQTLIKVYHPSLW
jgi:hypothetical protein